jgi:hypothetical protein
VNRVTDHQMKDHNLNVLLRLCDEACSLPKGSSSNNMTIVKELEPSLPEDVTLEVKTNLIEDIYVGGRFNFF